VQLAVLKYPAACKMLVGTVSQPLLLCYLVLLQKTLLIKNLLGSERQGVAWLTGKRLCSLALCATL
jgi:hypothetical protein